MDFKDILQVSGISATGIAIVLLLYRIANSIKNKKFISDCCGKKGEIGFTVRDMGTPPRNHSENILTSVKVEDVRKNHSKQESEKGGSNESNRGNLVIS